MNLSFRLVFLLGGLLVALNGPLSAQEPTRLSLVDAINFAYDQNTEIKNARIKLLDAQQQIIQRRSAGFPQLSADVSFQRYLQVPVQPLPEAFVLALEQLFPPGNGMEIDRNASFFLKNNFTAGLNLDAMIFDASYFVGLKAARAFREMTAQELEATKRQVRTAVTDAFLPALLLEENREILQKNIANLEKLLAETTELYREGFAEQLDVDRQQLSLNNLKAQRDNLDRQAEAAVNRLKYVLNFPVDQALELEAELEELAAAADSTALTAEANPQIRPDFLVAERGEELSQLNVRLNQSAYIPRLSAFGAYQRQYQGNNFRDGFWAPTAFVGLRLSIPLFDGFNRRSTLERARLDLEQVQNQKLDLARAIRLETATARANLLNAREVLQQQRSNVDLANRIYETTQIKYREGVGSSVELTQAEQSLYSAQSNYIQSLYDLVVAQHNLNMALGR